MIYHLDARCSTLHNLKHKKRLKWSNCQDRQDRHPHSSLPAREHRKSESKSDKFCINIINIIIFRAPATYQYSVLNSFNNDPEDELTDHLRVGDDFIVTNDSSDDDVELLGVSKMMELSICYIMFFQQNSLINPRMDTGSLLLSFGSGQNPTPLIGTVAHPTQVRNNSHISLDSKSHGIIVSRNIFAFRLICRFTHEVSNS